MRVRQPASRCLAFVAIAVLRIPLLTTMLVLTPVSVVRVAPPRRGHAAAGAGRGARRAARRPAMNDTLIAIATIFSQLSLLAFGGGTRSCRRCSGRSSTSITG